MSNKQQHTTSKTVIISGGGTGGHIYPALAIANALKEDMPGVKILFVGALGKMEMQKVPEAGYEIIGLNITGLQRSLSPKNLLFPFKLLFSYLKARSIIKQYNPSCVVGVGGYASGPIMLAAQKKGVPTLIQEQNSHAGITNKRLAKRAKAICVAYEGMEKHFPKDKIVFTGNPVRSDILNVENKREEAQNHFGLDPTRKTILAIGGSLGALSINESLKKSMERFTGRTDVQLIWQTGKYFYPKAKDLEGQNVKVHEFIKRMDLAYAAADIVMSRAGALSISELCLVAKPSILVPFPYAAEDHQTHNAMSLVKNEAAMLVPDDEAREVLVDKTFALLEDVDMQKRFSTNILKSAKPEAAKEIVAELKEIMN